MKNVQRYPHENGRLQSILQANDRRGERAIAVGQSAIAGIVFLFHLVSAQRNQWETFSAVTIGIAGLILIACLVRLKMAQFQKLPTFWLNVLTVIDGILIFTLIGSYSWAYALPLETSFKAPSIIFLVVYTSIRVVKLDPVPIMVAGATVLTGWLGLLTFVLWNGAERTTSYVDYVSGAKVLVGANIEMAAGYLAVIAVLTIATNYARSILANSADLEELAEAKEIAESNAARQNAMLQSSSDGIVIVDETGVIERINPALNRMFGYKDGELTGQSVATLMSNENALLLASDIEKYRNLEESRLVGEPFESEGMTSKGTTIPIELSISGFKTSGNQYFAGFVRDISARKQTQANETEALSKFEDVVTAALDAIVVIDDQGIVREFNPAAEEVFGFKRLDVVGKDMSAFIVPEHHRSAHRSGMKHYLATGEGPVLNQRIEIDAVKSDGSSIMIELAIKERKSPTGSLFFGYMRDITEKKAAEETLRDAKEKAEAGNRAKSSFLAMMSHEIRTPLNGVLGVLTLLSDSVRDGENAKLISTARRSGKALLAIINDILDFSKLEAGKLDLEIASFYTDALLDTVHSLVRQQAESKKLNLSFDKAADVPDVLLGDQDRIRQILLNLVNNAVKFTDSGSVVVSVTSVGSVAEPNVRFSIADTGIGVAVEDQKLLFAEFATIDASYARRFGGTGLGLSICKALSEAMDGSIGFESEKGKGSTFWFELPLDAGDAESVLEDSSAELSRTFKDKLADTRILLAEDNVTNQLIVGNMLERLGCKVDIASNGQEAIDGIKQREYDAILMDVSMPEMDGITATKKIRQLDGRACKTPIVALTAYATDEDRQRVLAAGMNDFVSKPISRIELARAIARQTNPLADKSGFEHDDAKSNLVLFDEAVLGGILADMDDGLRRRILSEFENDIRRHLADLQHAVADENAEKFERATHGLKGVSGTFGATELQRLSGTANSLIRTGKADAGFEMASQIEDIAEAVLTSVSEFYQDQSDGSNNDEGSI